MTDAYSAELINTLQSGGVAVIRTDTIYGIVGRADNEATVERIFRIKGRASDKSPIILIADPANMFDSYDTPTLAILEQFWPGKNSVILPSHVGPHWITRGNASIAYRLPSDAALLTLIRHVGPLVAPSANPEGAPPATTIDEARAYFGDLIDYYEDGGIVSDTSPSSLYRLDATTFTQLR